MSSSSVNTVPVISICIATYNRRVELDRLLRSVGPETSEIEVIIVDDGSTDGSDETAKKFAVPIGFAQLKYVWQPNQGRGAALLRSISLATGQYIILMDSDDYFLEDWSTIVLPVLRDIQFKHETPGARPIIGAVFHGQRSDGQLVGGLFPTTLEPVNLIKLRADLGIVGDKKEIISRSALLKSLYTVTNNERRIPTALLWARVSELGDCSLCNKGIFVKNYQIGGITKNLFFHRYSNPQSMAELNEIYLFSSLYCSVKFRLKACVQYTRYTIIAGKRPRYWLIFLLFFPIGIAVAIGDFIRFKIGRRL